MGVTSYTGLDVLGSFTKSVEICGRDLTQRVKEGAAPATDHHRFKGWNRAALRANRSGAGPGGVQATPAEPLVRGVDLVSSRRGVPMMDPPIYAATANLGKHYTREQDHCWQPGSYHDRVDERE